MQIKLHHRNTIRRLAVGDITYADLAARVADLFGLRPESVVLKYVDDEDDLVTFSTDGELADALRLAQGLDGPLKIAVLEQQAPRAAGCGGRRGWRGPCGPFGGFGPLGRLQHVAAQLEPVIGQIDVAPFVQLALNLDNAAVQAGLPELVATVSEAVGKVLAGAEEAVQAEAAAHKAETSKAGASSPTPTPAPAAPSPAAPAPAAPAPPSPAADDDWHKVTPPASATDEALQFLADMGYADTALNTYLLKRFNGSIPRVVQELTQ